MSIKNVRQQGESGKYVDLGPKKAFFTYLKIENNGRADAKDCMITVLQPTLEDTAYSFPVELPLTYFAITRTDMEILLRTDGRYEFWAFGNPILREDSHTITKKGGQTTLFLAFTIDGFQNIFIGSTLWGAGVMKLKPITLVLRTSVDGKTHRVKLDPMPTGAIQAQILS